MHIDDMNWNDLKFFLALSRQGSLSGAGRELGVKHTTVARRIQMLESYLGTRLFDRSRSGYAMTQAAENLFEQVAALEEKIRRIDQQGSGQDAALAGPLKLTIAHELANRLIIPELEAFCSTYPEIELELIMTKNLMDLGAMEADLALRMTPNPPENLVGRKLMTMKHGIYGPVDMVDQLTEQGLLQEKEQLKAKELLEQKGPLEESVQGQKETPVKVILFDDEIEPPAWVTDHFNQFSVVLRVDDVGSMAVAAAKGMGLVKLPCFIGETEPGLKRLNLATSPSKWGIWLLYHTDLRATARVRACKDFIEQIVQQKQSIILGEAG